MVVLRRAVQIRDFVVVVSSTASAVSRRAIVKSQPLAIDYVEVIYTSLSRTRHNWPVKIQLSSLGRMLGTRIGAVTCAQYLCNFYSSDAVLTCPFHQR